MTYEIHITTAAERDLAGASDYIEFVLKNPTAADDLLDEAEKQISSLAEYPEKYKLVDDPVLSSWGIRFVMVKGYLAFYIISEELNRVIIVRFLFQKSNWASILRRGIEALQTLINKRKLTNSLLKTCQLILMDLAGVEPASESPFIKNSTITGIHLTFPLYNAE